MYSSTILSFTLAASLVAAAPQSNVHQFGKRDWISSNSGNIKIFFSDSTVDIGDVTTDTIMNKVASACNDEGSCDTATLSFKGQTVAAGADGDVEDITVSAAPQGSYPTWIHNGLIDALTAAVKAAAKCKQVTNDPNCGDSPYYCPAKPFTSTQCTVPTYWAINYQAPDSANSAPPAINVQVTEKVDGSNFCQDFTTIGGAVAGAVNGVAGGIFTLAGLFCQL